jgi:hypothetical protein
VAPDNNPLSAHTPAAGEPAAEERRPYRRTELRIEREQFTVHYQPGTSYSGRCPQCGREVLMLTAEAAAVTVGATRREVYRWVEQEALHFQEATTGEVFLCSVSLQRLRHRSSAVCKKCLSEPGLQALRGLFRSMFRGRHRVRWRPQYLEARPEPRHPLHPTRGEPAAEGTLGLPPEIEA